MNFVNQYKQTVLADMMEIMLMKHFYVYLHLRNSFLCKYQILYPPGSKSEDLRLGVHLILLYFITFSLLYPMTFFYFGVGVGVGVECGLFLSLSR